MIPDCHPDRKHHAKGLCQSCYQAKWQRKGDPKKKMLNGLKHGAMIRGIPFDIDIDDLIIPNFCPVLGIPLYRSGIGRTDNSPSVDRIDNSKGYVKDNILVVSWRANHLKGDANIDELLKLAEFYSNLSKIKEEK